MLPRYACCVCGRVCVALKSEIHKCNPTADTRVSYEGGREVTLQELPAATPDCVIPHVVRSRGIKLTTKVRLDPLTVTYTIVFFYICV